MLRMPKMGLRAWGTAEASSGRGHMGWSLMGRWGRRDCGKGLEEGEAQAARDGEWWARPELWAAHTGWGQLGRAFCASRRG